MRDVIFLLSVLALPAAVCFSFPHGMFYPAVAERANDSSPVCSFIALSEEDESRVLLTMRGTLHAGSVVSDMSVLPLGRLPEVGYQPVLRADDFRFSGDREFRVGAPFSLLPPSCAAGPAGVIPVEPDATSPDEPVFPRAEMLELK